MIFSDSLPAIRSFARSLGAITSTLLRTRALAGFLEPCRRMSATHASSAIRTNTCHRANVGRYLARRDRDRDWELLDAAAYQLLRLESRSRTWSLLPDQTHVGQSGIKTENTFRRGTHRPRTKNAQRHQKKTPRRSCHAFVMALLLTPSGYRIPMCRCYFTKTYAAANGWTYHTQTQLAAELIRRPPIPAAAEVVALGDTAFDAEVMRAACAARGYSWVVPMNPGRVPAGPNGNRPRVRSLAAGLSAKDVQAVRLDPGQGEGRRQRRPSRYRVGPEVKRRTYHVHGEHRDIHSVGKGVVGVLDDGATHGQKERSRAEDPDDQRSGFDGGSGGRVVRSSRAGRVVLQGVEEHAGVRALRLPFVRGGGGLDAGVPGGVRAPGVASGEAVEAAWPVGTGASGVGEPTHLRWRPGRPPVG